MTCQQCGRDSAKVSGGICNRCRSKNYRDYHISQGPEYRAKRAAAERERRKRLGDEYRRMDRERNMKRREYRIAYCRAYYEAHKEERAVWYLDYIKRRRDVAYAIKARYKARKAQLPATLTPQDWQDIKDGFDHRCVYCNRQMHRLTQEHIVPVTKGGGYTPDNIVPACGSCNSRKHTQDAFEFLLSRSHAVSTTP